MTARLETMMKMNPVFAKTLADCEPWAVRRAESIRGIDGQAGRRHPERTYQEDGHTRRNWCGGCSDPEGCVTCDLDQPMGKDYKNLKSLIGKDKRR